MNLNQNAHRLCQHLLEHAEMLRISEQVLDGGARIIDCGIATVGGLHAGRYLAEICMAGLGRVDWVRSDLPNGTRLSVMVTTDQPVAACMASQYAGWKIAHDDFFSMGSGPMRALAAKEELFGQIGFIETSPVAVGVLECGQIPTDEICRRVAADCGVKPEQLTLLVAPTTSQAGNLQIVARSVETALHKIYELGEDLSRIESGIGLAPLPPVAGDPLTAIGRTNDAILYGGEVTLYVRGDDESLQRFGSQVPSSASKDHGQPFTEIFERFERDFYRIDPHLFSPAIVNFMNLDTGRSFRFGELRPDVLETSFGTALG